jgi:hypothetical protein
MVGQCQGDAGGPGQEARVIGGDTVVEVLESVPVAGVEGGGDRCCGLIGQGRVAGGALEDSGVTVAQGWPFHVPGLEPPGAEGGDGLVCGEAELLLGQSVCGQGEGTADAGRAVTPGVASAWCRSGGVLVEFVSGDVRGPGASRTWFLPVQEPAGGVPDRLGLSGDAASGALGGSERGETPADAVGQAGGRRSRGVDGGRGRVLIGG